MSTNVFTIPRVLWVFNSILTSLVILVSAIMFNVMAYKWFQSSKLEAPLYEIGQHPAIHWTESYFFGMILFLLIGAFAGLLFAIMRKNGKSA